MTKLTKEQMDAWAKVRVRMLLARLITMALQGRVIP